MSSPNRIQIRHLTLSNVIVNETREEKERYSNQKTISQVIQETKEKAKKIGSVSCTELYLILTGGTATLKQGSPSSASGDNLSGAESTASV